MDNSDYKEALKEFYASIARFVTADPRLVEELKARSAFFRFLEMGPREKTQFALDWFIFDVKVKCLGKTVFQHWLENVPLDADKKSLYEAFTNGIFGLFEILAVRTGKEMLIHDLIHDEDYNVQDGALSKTSPKGRCVFVRVLPFRDSFILTGGALIFPVQATPFLKLSLKNHLAKGNFSLSPLTILKLYFTPKKPETLSLKERFILFCQEGGLEEDYIQSVIDRMGQKAKEKADFYELLNEVMAKLKIDSKAKLDEVTRAFTALWNSFIRTSHGYVEAGPVERNLMAILVDQIRPQLDLGKEDADTKANQLCEEWLSASLEELGGRTPKEVILEEREELENPQKEVKFSFKLTEVAPGREILEKAKDTFEKASELLRQNKPHEAIEAYKEHLLLQPTNHVAWQNLGVAYLLLLDTENAKRSFRKALEIKPDYEMASGNLKLMEKSTPEEMEAMAKGFRVGVFNG